MSIDWQSLEEKYGNFKPQAPEGTYKVKVDKAEVKQLPSGSIGVTFSFANSKDYSFPRATHWVSIGNIGWTQWHHKQLLEVFGVNKDNAKKAIENATDKEILNPTELVNAFQKIYDRAVEKKPELEIVVRPQYDKDGNLRYSDKGYQQFESEFTDQRIYSDNKPKAKAPTVFEPTKVDEMGEAVDFGDDEVPF